MKNLSLLEIAQSIQDKKFSCQEVVQFFLNRTKKLNPKLGAVITINEQVLDQAKAIDQKGLSGLPLEGVPILFKDMFCTKGIRTTAGSKILCNFIPPYSATVVKRLTQAGCLILGKCNQDEFAMGNSNEHSYFGNCKNPWDLSRTPGGSSGGSACAVSASLAPAAMGTDTGGSIRQPSHFCNVMGIKPTYGRVSRFGIVAYASSLDQAGPIAQKVEDASLILKLISGFDPNDVTTCQKEVPDWHKNLKTNIKNIKVGWMKAPEVSHLVQQSLDQTRKALESQKASIKEIDLPMMDHALSVYYLISSSEASSNLARYDGIRYGNASQKSSDSLRNFYEQTRGEGFGREVKRRILMGTFCLSHGYFEAYFKKAQQVRRLLRDEFKKIFQEVDVIVAPITENAAPLLDQKTEGDIRSYTSDSFTVSSNLAGLPSLSVPVGLFNNLPLGVQLIGSHFDEQKILDVAYFLQEEFQAYKNKPVQLDV